jgi:hypothetical protein
MLVAEDFALRWVPHSIEKTANALKWLSCMTDMKICQELTCAVRIEMFHIVCLDETLFICNGSTYIELAVMPCMTSPKCRTRKQIPATKPHLGMVKVIEGVDMSPTGSFVNWKNETPPQQ